MYVLLPANVNVWNVACISPGVIVPFSFVAMTKLMICDLATSHCMRRLNLSKTAVPYFFYFSVIM